VAYCGEDDLLLNNVQLSTSLSRLRYVQDAAEEIDSYLGWRYVTPVDISETSPVPKPVKLTLKRLNAHLATGRLILAASMGIEDDNLHAYGESLVAATSSILKELSTGDLLPGIPQEEVGDQKVTGGPSIANEDCDSLVESFYDGHPFGTRSPLRRAPTPVVAESPLYLTYVVADGRYVLRDDPRLTDLRNPLAHATSHGVGGSDPLLLSDLPLTIEQGTTQVIVVSDIRDGVGAVVDPTGWALRSVARVSVENPVIVAEWSYEPTGTQGLAEVVDPVAAGLVGPDDPTPAPGERWILLHITPAMSGEWQWNTAHLYVHITESVPPFRGERIADRQLVNDRTTVY
jgi:phage gp36-like protein